MRPAPFGVTLLRLAEHKAESDAGLPVAAIAELVHADHFGFAIHG
jgi:hypothetical protein